MINKIANIANKTLKAASRLGFDVGVFTQKNSQQSNNPSDKSDSKNKCKRILDIVKECSTMVFSNRLFGRLAAYFLSKEVKNDTASIYRRADHRRVYLPYVCCFALILIF